MNIIFSQRPSTEIVKCVEYSKAVNTHSRSNFHCSAILESSINGNSFAKNINFMSSTDKSDSDADSFGHSYFRNAPTVSSDLILTLRDDLDPGSPGRPLEYLGGYFWRVPPGYPAKK